MSTPLLRLPRGAGVGLGLTLLVVLVGPALAKGQDLGVDLADAQARVSAAEADFAAASDSFDSAKAQQRPVARRAEAATGRAEEAAGEADAIADELVATRQGAANEIRDAEATYQEEQDDYDKRVALGLGAGVALLVLALLPAFWTSFCSTAGVQRLAAESNDRAFGAIAAITLPLILIGGVFIGVGADVVAGAGAFLVTLAIGFAVAAFVARRQALGDAVPQGADPDQAPVESRSPGGLRGVMFGSLAILGLFLLAAPALASGPEEPEFSDEALELAALADADVNETPTAELRNALVALEPLERKASRLEDQRSDADRKVEAAGRRVDAAGQRLTDAENEVQSISKQIKQEEMAAARALAQAEKQAQKEAEQDAGGGGGGGGGGSSCEPGYSPCVPPYPPDLDCGDLNGPYTVTGSDPHGLDADNDGVGCE